LIFSTTLITAGVEPCTDSYPVSVTRSIVIVEPSIVTFRARQLRNAQRLGDQRWNDRRTRVGRLGPGDGDVVSTVPSALAMTLARAKASGAFTLSHQRYWDIARARRGDAGGTRALIDVLNVRSAS
jgi:hypothetical protein